MTTDDQSNSTFARYAWSFLGWLLLVILFGAWVRISFSGAGCGDHWPTCQGQFLPDTSDSKTLVEFTHRITSAIAGLLGLALFGWAWRAFSRGHRACKAAAATLFFLITESLIGAVLVKGGFVEHDDSVGRALVIGLHLVNTLGLSGSAVLCAWWAGGGRAPDLDDSPRSRRWLIGLALGGLVLTSVAGAVTALGDTLFPTDPTLGAGLLAKISNDVSAANHFLVRLRIIHPVIAVVVGVLVITVTSILRTSEVNAAAKRWSTVTLWLVVTQLVVGVANIWLGAPGWIQIVHLLFAQAVWLAALVMGTEALAKY